MDIADLDPEDRPFGPIWDACRPYTMTSLERGLALFRAIRNIHQNFLAGDFVECGVWKGGSSMIAMMTLQHFGIANRRFWLFDTYAGMTEPSEFDVDRDGATAEYLMTTSAERRETEPVWAFASLEEVKSNVARTGYDPALVQYVVGDVRETIYSIEIGEIALLRLDTDFYDSTLVELEVLFPKLVENGVLLIDDFGHWYGARKAVDTYFDKYFLSGQTKPLLQYIDYTGRIAIKPSVKFNENPVERYDYTPPGLRAANLLGSFPELIARDVGVIDWIYLRRQVPHVWRSDVRARRQPNTGAISVEEAELLFNNALAFNGLRGVEVGCHYAWSTAHLVKAGLILDVIDPALGDDHHFSAVRDSLKQVNGPGSFALWPGYSPGVLAAVHATTSVPYAFAFIDGYHEGPSPMNDAKAAAQFMAADSCVMFHDLTSPYVAAGLAMLANAGWSTGIYNTMQIMGIAWRGKFEPVAHVGDPNVPLPKLSHLSRFDLLTRLA
ncbi:TylF/MycF/NovP-related O-methyltransferase [Sphingomonas sp. GlSt437]|uniref:TylF/MycF/NovP-related O-methyltransferase n=1 Tax=Sphingomonas sp. GlSt437 TaxID=3389970 RepID=UPI003A8B10C9